MFGRLLAERGLQVVVQSVRGTFGSGGDFTPFDERADGLATLRWLREPALAPRPGRDLRAQLPRPGAVGAGRRRRAMTSPRMAIQVSASQFYDQTYAGGGIVAGERRLVDGGDHRPGGPAGPLAIDRAVRAPARSMEELPLGDSMSGPPGRCAWYREAFANPST